MGFDTRANAKKYQAQEGDTLAKIAERECAAGNNLTWQDIARFNWGTDDPKEINIFFRDELGARLRDADNNFVISADDTPTGELLIPVRFKKQGLAPDKTHKLALKATPVPPTQFLQCCAVPGITFETDKSFVRPIVVGALQELDKIAKENPDAKIMIFGHTDKVGDDIYNKKLSERRAKSVYAFITDDVDTWEQLYNQESWGVATIQAILLELGHDPGPIDGIMGSQTEDAMRDFLGVPPNTPVKNDAPFRKKLFAAYMTGIRDVEISVDRFMEPKHMGCGEYNPGVWPQHYVYFQY